MPRRASAAALLLAAAVASACGARHQPPFRPGPIDFEYTAGGERLRLAGLRGRPVVLVLVRTAEVTSELYLDELAKAHAEIEGDTRLLVLSIDPNEAPFLAAYLEERALPFPIGLAEWPVAEGTSALGLVPIVPTTYLVGEDGAVVRMFPGAVTAAQLERELTRRGWE
jgi:hypothetical protein